MHFSILLLFLMKFLPESLPTLNDNFPWLCPGPRRGGGLQRSSNPLAQAGGKGAPQEPHPRSRDSRPFGPRALAQSFVPLPVREKISPPQNKFGSTPLNIINIPELTSSFITATFGFTQKMFFSWLLRWKAANSSPGRDPSETGREAETEGEVDTSTLSTARNNPPSQSVCDGIIDAFVHRCCCSCHCVMGDEDNDRLKEES